MLGPSKLGRDRVAGQGVLGCDITSVFLGGGFTRVGSRASQTPKVKLRANVVRHNLDKLKHRDGIGATPTNPNLFARLEFTA